VDTGIKLEALGNAGNFFKTHIAVNIVNDVGRILKG
jgi:hypothetical protein